MTYKATTEFSIPHLGGWFTGEEVVVDEATAATLLDRGLIEEMQTKKEPLKEELKKESNKLNKE